jgi:hypothetical protein
LIKNPRHTSCQQDDLLVALTSTRASELDRQLADTPIIQKLLLADGAEVPRSCCVLATTSEHMQMLLPSHVSLLAELRSALLQM